MPAKTRADRMIDEDFPQEVKDVITANPKVPEFDPTLGIPRSTKNNFATPLHRLVTIGDSLTQGYQSGAIFNTDLSYPMTIAWEMGWDRQFRRPASFSAYGGMQSNIEYYLRHLENRFGDKIDWWETASAVFAVRALMDENEDYWERGAGSNLYDQKPVRQKEINHNLAIYGWDIRDMISLTGAKCRQRIQAPQDHLLKQIVENANERVALRVLTTEKDPDGNWSSLDAAEALGKDGTPETGGDGIETLIVMIGANNVLGSVASLKVNWSGDKYRDLEAKKSYNAWLPSHFAAEFDELVTRVQQIKARHVIWCTVPHVTVSPIARGVGGSKSRPGSRYFPYYTRPWIDDDKFNPDEDDCISENQARALDSVVDSYNNHIVKRLRENRAAGKDWYVFDLCALLDRVAARRYIKDPQARPDWWMPYDLPAALQALTPPPDSQFFRSGIDPVSQKVQRTTGGLFSLDGIHPTTISYGIVAQEIINVMQQAGVKFYYGNNSKERVGPVRVDFQRLIKLDTLVSDPPRSLTNNLEIIGWLDEQLDIIRRIF
jgi:hypothetical protein